MKAALTQQAIRFVFAGAINTAVTITIYSLLLLFLSYVWAYSITYAIGIAINYWLNTRFVFQVTASLRTIAIYPLIYILQYLLGLSILVIAIKLLHITKFAGIFFSIFLPLPVTFVLTRFLLKKTKQDARAH